MFVLFLTYWSYKVALLPGIDDKERKGSHLNRPYPSSFKQVLSDPKSFAMFMKFLEMNLADENEAPLINFWHQVSELTSLDLPNSERVQGC